jgi:hypothetical protein
VEVGNLPHAFNFAQAERAPKPRIGLQAVRATAGEADEAVAESDICASGHSATTLSAAAQKFAQSLMRARRFSILAPR